MSLNSLTKAKLIERLTKMEAELISRGREVAMLRERLAITSSQPELPIGSQVHRAYYDYVAAERRAQRLGKPGCTVVRYLGFKDWLALGQVRSRSSLSN